MSNITNRRKSIVKSDYLIPAKLNFVLFSCKFIQLNCRIIHIFTQTHNSAKRLKFSCLLYHDIGVVLRTHKCKNSLQLKKVLIRFLQQIPFSNSYRFTNETSAQPPSSRFPPPVFLPAP